MGVDVAGAREGAEAQGARDSFCRILVIPPPTNNKKQTVFFNASYLFEVPSGSDWQDEESG